jgi:hypothetical protein
VSGVFGWVREHITDMLLVPLASGTLFVEFAEIPWGPWTVGYEFQVAGEQHRWVLDGAPSRGVVLHLGDAGRLDVPAHGIAQRLALDERRVPVQPFTLADLLPTRGEARALTLDAGNQWAELTREFAALAGIPVDQTQRQNYSLANVLLAVLRRGLMLLGDLRQPPRTDYAVRDVASGLSPADGSRIPVQLFRLKNGSAADRRQYSEIRDLFGRLTGRSFEVALAMALDADADGPEADLQISVLVEHGGQDLPIEHAGAGFWEALLLSAALPQSSGRVAVLDEPARNLHSTLHDGFLPRYAVHQGSSS